MLASTTAPTYSNDNGFMRGTLVTSTVGDYIVDQPGFLSTVDYSWQTSYPWEIKLLGNEDLGVQQLPHVLDVSLSFTPIHRFSVQTGQLHFITNKEAGVNFLDGVPINQPAPEPPSTEAVIAKLRGESAADQISKLAVKTDVPNISLPSLQTSNPTSGFNALAGNTSTSGFNSILKKDFTLTG